MNPLLLTASPQTPIMRLDLEPALAESTQQMFEQAAQAFRDSIEDVVDFDPGYDLQEGECFRIPDYQLGEDLLLACRQPIVIPRIEANQFSNLKIRAVIEAKPVGEGHEVYFQNFDARQVIIPGKKRAYFAAADPSTFHELQGPIVLLDNQITAIWNDGTLLFKSFFHANRIFDLTPYFTAATDAQVVEFASHPLFAEYEQSLLLKTCTSLYRKKIALYLRSPQFGQHSVQSLLTIAQSQGYTLPIDGNRIKIPAEKSELRDLLDFLNENFYLGALSQRPFVASSKRVKS